jgi:FSR family fosmidomycin resistance protein-like MFS transporter
MQERHEVGGLEALKPYARPLSLLYLIVVLRTLSAISFSTYMPVMLTRQGMSLGEAGVAVGLYLFASSAGGFLGGPLADRLGARIVILWSLALSVPFLAVSPLLSGWVFVAVVSAGGFLMQSSLPINVTFAQTIAPVSAATVSSIMLGLAFGTAGLVVPFVGLLADRIGIEGTLIRMAFVPLAAAALAFPLPAGKYVHAAARAADIGSPEGTGTDVAR